MSEYQCAAMVWAERFGNISGRQCERPGVNESQSGKWYCADHTPQQRINAQADPAADNEATGDKP